MPYNSILSDIAFQNAISHCNITLIAPSSGMSMSEFEDLLSLPFLNFTYPNDLLSNDIPYHANTDLNRLQALTEALYNDSDPSNILWALRGGYGAARLLDGLSTMKKPAVEKTVIGCSDITALHLFLSQHWGWKTLHAPVFQEFLREDRNPLNLKILLDIVQGRKKTTEINGLLPIGSKSPPPSISGSMTGGNLTLIQTSIGTHWQMKGEGKILFLEDVGEKGYYIDRSLNHMLQAGLFKGVEAIVFGEFCNPRDDKIDFALQRFAQETTLPVFKTNQFGHGNTNYPIAYLSKAEIVREGKEYSLRMDLRD